MEVGPSVVWQTCLVVFWYSLWVVYWVGRSETVEESIDGNAQTALVLCSGSNSDRLQALYTVSNYKSKRV